MCTVTFIPSKEQVWLSANRDEKSLRSPALPPAVYQLGSGHVLFPRDRDAGGTWIAAHENGNSIVFLNGAWVAHRPQPPYRKSRGLVLLDLIAAIAPVTSFNSINLDNIEPFTAVIRDARRLYECRWDGEKKYCRELDASVPHIWSSVTLYSPDIISKRKSWFERWLQQHPHPAQNDIMHFHQFTGDGDTGNDLMMNRQGQVFTVSITSLALTPQYASMLYFDLKNGQQSRQELIFEKSMVSL